jgi:hypothetical protein
MILHDLHRLRNHSPPIRNLHIFIRTPKGVFFVIECYLTVSIFIGKAHTIRSMINNMNSNKKTARIAGVLYLLVGIFGGFAEGFVDPKMYVAGNAAVTAGNVVVNSELVRLGVVSHLLDGTFFVFLAMTLYVLLQHVHKSVARAMLILVVLATGIICLNAVFQFEALQVATSAVNMNSLGHAGSNAVVLLLLDTQHYGTLIAQVFFGLWLVPLGYLAYKSDLFHKWLGVVLIVGGICYIVDLLAAFLVPNFGQTIHTFIVIPSAIAEISMVVYLLVIGVKNQKLDKSTLH